MAVALFLPMQTGHFAILRKKDQKSRSGWSRTTVFALSERRTSVALPSVLLLHFFSRDGWNRTSFHVFPKHAGARSPSSRFFFPSRDLLIAAVLAQRELHRSTLACRAAFTFPKPTACCRSESDGGAVGLGKVCLNSNLHNPIFNQRLIDSCGI